MRITLWYWSVDEGPERMILIDFLIACVDILCWSVINIRAYVRAESVAETWNLTSTVGPSGCGDAVHLSVCMRHYQVFYHA